MEGPAGLQQRLVDPATTSNNTDSRPGATANGLLGATGQPDAGLVLFGRVANDGGVVTGRTGKGATVTDLLLDVADDGTFRAGGDRENIADSEGGLLSAVNESTSVETLGSNESLLAKLVAVGITEDNTGERSTTVRAELR